MPERKLTKAELKAYQELARAARRVRQLAARRKQRTEKPKQRAASSGHADAAPIDVNSLPVREAAAREAARVPLVDSSGPMNAERRTPVSLVRPPLDSKGICDDSTP